MDLEKYRWPRKGDRLLRNADDWERGVDFSQHEISRHALIWDGYLRAGATLIDVCNDDPYMRKVLIYPILFNYRHGIELAMKWMIARYAHRSPAKVEEYSHHNLWRLWKICRKVLEDIGSNDTAIVVVEQVIKDFHELDRSALAFRYSRDKNGAVISLPDGLIDLENIKNVMTAVGHFFDGLDGLLDSTIAAIEY